MINTIIFSKNRACQLDLLLTSAKRNLSDMFRLNVVYTATNQSFSDGYERVVQRFDNVNFIEETDFQQDTLSLVEGSEKYVCFLVDDNIVYRPVVLEDIDSLFGIEGFACLSLRLGPNTTVQSPYTNQMCPMPEYMTIVENKYVLWNWRMVHPHTNFGYPFSVDGNIFTKKTTLDVITKYDFNNPNALEGRANVNNLPTRMACLSKQSAVVNTPINIVGSSNGDCGAKFGVSLEELNEKYLDGEVVDFDAMDFSNITCCHQEIELVFKQDS